jgi:integrase
MRRRQRGTVGFRNGKWFIYYRTPAGKQVYQRGFPSEAAAIARLNDIMAEIYRGEYIDHKEITFAEFAEGYLSRRLSIRGSTSSSYASMIRHHLIPYFGSMKLAEIRLDMIQSFVHEFGENRSVKTLHNIVTLLKVMLVGSKGSSAIKQGYIHHDPTRGMELPPLQPRSIVPPTQEFVWKLINVASFLGQNADAMVHLGAFTGLRRGELLALHFTDIDWTNKEIIVNKAVSRFPAGDGVHRWKWKIGSTKTKRSIRRVAVSDDILHYLTRMRRTAADPDGLLFPGPEAKLMDPDTFDSLFAEIKKSAGLPDVRFHDLRHFFASLLISQGFSPKYVCDQLGHSSIQMTFDTYGHLFPTAREEASAKLEEVIRKGRRKAIASDLLAQEEESNSEEETPKYVN